MTITNDKYCVYAHINKVNGKIYVGQTCQNPKYRWNNGEGYKRSSYFYNAIKKYGWNGFEHIIVLNDLSLEDANYFEEILIQRLDTTNPTKGYNLQSGGKNYICSEIVKQKMKENHADFKGINHPNYGKHWSEEVRRRMSEAHKGKYASEETKQKMSESRRGDKSLWFGRHHTEESKRKMSETRKGTRTGVDNPVARKVICLETNEIFDTIQEASEKTNTTKGNICKCCQGKRKTTGGFHWAYYNNEEIK